MAKEPIAGRVKTRLAEAVGDARALALYRAFLSDLAKALFSPDEWRSELAHAEPEAGPFLRSAFSAWTFRTQGEGSLGDRLARCARTEDEGDVVLVGSDAPLLTALVVRDAFHALTDRAEVVFAPAPDGGYSLVGLRHGVPGAEVFASVRWSTEHALADSRAAAERAGCRVALLPEAMDVDVAADLETLRAALAANPGLAPVTCRALAEGPA